MIPAISALLCALAASTALAQSTSSLRISVVDEQALVEGRVTAVDRDSARLTLELTRLYTADRQRVAIQTESFERRTDAPPGRLCPLCARTPTVDDTSSRMCPGGTQTGAEPLPARPCPHTRVPASPHRPAGRIPAGSDDLGLAG